MTIEETFVCKERALNRQYSHLKQRVAAMIPLLGISFAEYKAAKARLREIRDLGSLVRATKNEAPCEVHELVKTLKTYLGLRCKVLALIGHRCLVERDHLQALIINLDSKSKRRSTFSSHLKTKGARK
jgi:hypothetical protein